MKRVMYLSSARTPPKVLMVNRTEAPLPSEILLQFRSAQKNTVCQKIDLNTLSVSIEIDSSIEQIHSFLQ